MPKRAQPPGGTEQSPKKRRVSGDDGLHKLCRRCSEVVASSRDAPVRAGSGIEIACVDESVDQLRSSACKFCRLLACIKQPSLDGAECRLYGFSANDVYAHARLPVLRQSGVSDSVLLGVLPASGRRSKEVAHDFIGVTDSRRAGICIGPRKTEPHKLDYPTLKSWVAFCQSKHKTLCLPPSTKSPPMLQVIDVVTCDVVPAPKDCQYVALSYVWGNPTPETIKKFPRVVEDSLAVIKELGYRYLWVDQYCIDQDNADVKLRQINAMNLVYGNARLTIIAAAGEDSAYGLPGVGLRQRVTQEHVCVDEAIFIRTFPHASEALKESRWATRGWTFQEGLLSNRRLIFTDQQVAYQCNGMHCSEAVYWPFELMHAKSQRMFPQNVPAPLFRSSIGRKFYNVYKPYLNLTDHILEYSKRSLSHQSDRLNAILGILADWEARKEPIYHVWGVLVSPNFTGFGGGNTGWDIRLGSWYHQEPCSRQPSFPSWSWAGWSGPLTKAPFVYSCFKGPLLQAELEKDRDGKAPERISLSTFVHDHQKYREYVTGSPFLWLSVKMVDIRFTSVQWSVSEAWKQAYYTGGENASERRDNAFKDGIYAEFPHPGYTELSYFYADNQELDLASLPGQSMQAFLVEREFTGDTLIAVVPKGDHYERAGYLICHGSSAQPHPDIAYRRADGKLTKTRPEAPVGDDDDGILDWEERLKTMYIRLG